MSKLIKFKGIKSKVFLIFCIIMLFSQIFILRVAADNLKDGDLEVSSGDTLNILLGTKTILNWQFEVDTNERAIYWEIIGYNVSKAGWGPKANCTTPILNETDISYNYVCHGYYAKYHVWSTMIIICSETEQLDGGNGGGDDSIDPMFFFAIGIPIVIVSVIALIVVVYFRRKKNQDFF